MREDGKALTPYQVEALSHYLPVRAIAGSFKDSLGAGLVERTKRDALGFMTIWRNIAGVFFLDGLKERRVW